MDDLPKGIPAYFYVTANAGGSVESARELGAETDAGKQILPSLRTLSFPKIEADGRALGTVYLVKVARTPGGKVLAARSVAAGAVAIATDLEPEEFPLPATANPPVPSAAVADASKSNGGASAPQVLQKIAAKYSEDARKARLTGTVLVRCVAGVDGLPHDLQVVRSLGLGLDEMAVAAVAAWRFAPAEKEGKAVDAAITVEVIFQMLGDGGDRSCGIWGERHSRLRMARCRPPFGTCLSPTSRWMATARRRP